MAAEGESIDIDRAWFDGKANRDSLRDLVSRLATPRAVASSGCMRKGSRPRIFDSRLTPAKSYWLCRRVTGWLELSARGKVLARSLPRNSCVSEQFHVPDIRRRFIQRCSNGDDRRAVQ